MKMFFFVLSLALIGGHLFAQQDAWVYFTDKENVAASISTPISILTQKAIDRKNAHGINIDERDVPVNESYITQLKTQTGITVLAKSKWFNATHVRGSQSDIEALIVLNFVSSIDFADKSLNNRGNINKTKKHESKFKEQLTDFNYGNTANQIEMINVNALHVLNYTGEGMTVAVLDGGFSNVNIMGAFQRLREAGNLLGTYDFVNRSEDVFINAIGSHGTNVLSCMAGYIQDEYVGTAPDAKYYLFTTEDGLNENPVEESYWVEAAERADSLGIDVINTSLGYGAFYDNPNYNYSVSEYDGYTTFITKGANIAFEKGLLLVNSAGNEGLSGVNVPADSPNVLSVGAVNANGEYVTFSSVGSTIQPTQKPDVVAQGQASYIITNNNTVATANGTSFSSPILAGGVVCLWQALPEKTNAEIMQLIRESASQYDTPDYFLGFGIPNFQEALNLGLSINTNISNQSKIIWYPNPVEERLNLKIESNQSLVRFQLYDVLGKAINGYDSVFSQSKSINMEFLPTGIYIAKLTYNAVSKTFKLVKQ
ncbi:S8 family serine peptidase [Flavisericum labens]|uniref:S8 family serine peptidase n=1 Tax=Flavisericum labens TaxID=3377112 RepID=UPI00387AD764